MIFRQVQHFKLLYLILLVVVGLPIVTTTINFGVSILSALLICFLIFKENNSLSQVPKISWSVGLVLVLITLNLTLFGWTNGQKILQELSREPGREFTTDMRGFLKTYYLIKSGENFTSAFEKAMTTAFASDFHIDLAGWRQPLIFYVWTMLPGNGSSIYFLALGMFAVMLWSAYLIARSFLSPAGSLVATFLLSSYLHYPLSDLTILQLEWWALGFLLVGLVFFFRNQLFLAGIFFALTLASREMFLVPIFCLVVLSLLTRQKRNLLQLIFPLLVFGIYYFSFYLPPLLKYQSDLVRNFHWGEVKLLQATLAFSTWNYLLGTFRPILILIILTTVFLLLAMKKGNRVSSLKLLSLYLPMLGFLAFAALSGRMTRWHDYWGIYFAPLVLIISPMAVGLLNSGKEPKFAGQSFPKKNSS